ncbi:glycosyltransferase family 4 protein [Chryseomicrobium palamuruense]
MSKIILVLSNHDLYTYNLRKEILEALLKKGYKVVISVPHGPNVRKLEKLGCKVIDSPINRRSKGIRNNLNSLTHYFKLVKELRPNLIISFTIKPNLYGGLISRVFNIPFIPNITGLGSALQTEGIIKKILTVVYKVAFKKANIVFFQNSENAEYFVENNIVKDNYNLLPGSGINIQDFPYLNYPTMEKNINVLYIGRIMEDKGLIELISAAKIIREKYKDVFFHTIGYIEDDFIDLAKSLNEREIIKFHGLKSDVKGYIKDAHVIINPSYHEGMSNVLLEASASGRPLLASNIPGCKEIVSENVNGFLFKPKDINSMVEAIENFINISYQSKLYMGIKAREKVGNEFNREIVVKEYLKETSRILEGNHEFV